MEIKEIKKNKKQFLSLLLLADEQEDMIDQYLERGTMYVLDDDDGIQCECVVTDEGNNIILIKYHVEVNCIHKSVVYFFMRGEVI